MSTRQALEACRGKQPVDLRSIARRAFSPSGVAAFALALEAVGIEIVAALLATELFQESSGAFLMGRSGVLPQVSGYVSHELLYALRWDIAISVI